MHRLIPSRYSEAGTVLEGVVDTDAMLADVARLDAATNERIQGELYGLSGISHFELVYGIPDSHIIRAAFLHPGPFGARFNDTTRGAWYAAEAVETSVTEVVYHKAKRLAEMVVPESSTGKPDDETSFYDDWQADFYSRFHCLKPPEQYADCLHPEPVPQCYGPSQRLARQLLSDQSNGVIYPSVRHKGRICLVCFRPALVHRPRRSNRYEIRLRTSRKGYESVVRVAPL